MSDGRTTAGYDWVVLNQSQSPTFQRLLERLGRDLGRGLLLTGTPHGASTPHLDVRRGPVYSRRGLASRARSWAAFGAVAAATLARTSPSSFVLTTTNPPALPNLAWAWARGRGGRFGVIVWDLYPDHLVRMGWIGHGHFVTRAWTRANRRAFLDAAFVTTIGEGIARGIARQVEPDVRSIDVIPLWADTGTIRPLEKHANPFAREHGLTDRTVVLYAGNIGATHDLGGLLAAAERLRHDTRLQFVLIGDGLGRSRVVQEVSERRLDNVTLLPYQPWDVVPYSLAVGDIAVVAQGRSAADLSVPSKTYAALAAGSAILALTPADSDLARLVRRYRVGEVAAPDDPDAIVRTLRSILDSPGHLAELRARARRVAETDLGFEAAVARFRDLLLSHVQPASE